MDLISILISDDPDPEMQDLNQVEIPPELNKQLDRDGRETGTTTISGQGWISDASSLHANTQSSER